MKDLPYRQSWFPLFPVVIVISRGGVGAIREDPFEVQICPKCFCCFFVNSLGVEWLGLEFMISHMLSIRFKGDFTSSEESPTR